MKAMKIISVFLGCIVLMLGVGCKKRDFSLDSSWSSPIKITESEDSLGGGISLYKWQGKIVALQPQPDGIARCYLLNTTYNTWMEASLTGVPRGYLWYRPSTDENGKRVFFDASYMENDLLVIIVLVGSLEIGDRLSLKDATERKWLVDVKSLFGKSLPNVRLTEPGRRIWPAVGIGLMNSHQEMYIPFGLAGVEVMYRGKQLITDSSKGPFASGVFHSTDSGATWQIEKIPMGGSIVRTEKQLYLFGMRVANEGDQLWFTRKAITEGSWDVPTPFVKTYANNNIAVGENDTVHLCWLDNRNRKKKLSPSVFPPAVSREVHNYEVAYRNRKDGDAKWGEEVVLSKGLLYSFPPTMSVEGDKVVIAWAGIEKAGSWHTRFDPNNIYYVTSKDGGRTWTDPLKVTDNAKDGITSGDPQVQLLNGVIHLTYIQGKINYKEVSAGMVKLNQPPWPIYYTQRPFPN